VPLSALAVDLTPLRVSPRYRALYFGQLVSVFGSAITYVALPWQMYRLTGSNVLVGLVGVVEFVPMLLLAPVGGLLADSVDRRRIVALAETGLTLVALVLMANALLGEPRVAVIFGCAAVHAALSAIARPARDAITPRVVPRELIPAAAALSALLGSIGFVAGPALAGVIVDAWGAHVAYGLDAASFVASLVSLRFVGSVPPADRGPREERGLQAVFAGWRYARSRQELLGTYLIDLNAMFFGMPMALFPAIAERYGGGSVGLLYAAPGLGAFLVGFSSGWVARVRRHGLAVAVAAGIWGLAIIAFGVADRLPLAILFLAVAGGADAVSGIFRMTIWNQTIPDELRGRLAAIEQISYLTGPYLGNAEAGLVAGVFGVRASVLSGGALCVIGSVAIAAALPRFLAYETPGGIRAGGGGNEKADSR
jgi:MFS family permease